MKKRRILGFVLLLVIISYCIFILIDTYIEIQSTNNTLVQEEEKWIPVSEVDTSQVSKDIIGYLSINCLNNDFYKDMPIKDGTDLGTLATAIGHFLNSPYTNGNVCLAAHNSGTKNGVYVGFFDNIKKLKQGDLIYYNNLENTFEYKVIENKVIKETDLSVLNNTEDNILTLITCIEGKNKRQYRQCVIAKRINK